MRVLLDENVPVELARDLSPHSVRTVVGLGWAGIKNGELLRRMSGQFEALITMDQGIEFQQPLGKQSFGVVLVIARSNRLTHVRALVPELLDVLRELQPGEVRRAGVRPSADA